MVSQVHLTSPRHVMMALDRVKQERDLGHDDQLWILSDVDRWETEELSEVAEKCNQKNYKFAVSNPCFEIWLLLHRKSIEEYSFQEIIELRKNKKSTTKNSKTRLEKELTALCGSYNKSKLVPQIAECEG